MKILRYTGYATAALIATLTILFLGVVFFHTPDHNNGYLHDAAMDRNPEAMREALECGADPNSSEHMLYLVLFDSDLRRNFTSQVEMVRLLIQYGVDVNATDSYDQQTPLHMAAQLPEREFFDMLVAAGADLEAKDKDGKGYLFYVVNRGCTPLLKEAIDKGLDVNKHYQVYGQDYTLLEWAVRQGDAEAVRILLEAGAEIPAPDMLWPGNAETALVLLKAGVDPEPKVEFPEVVINGEKVDPPSAHVTAARLALGQDVAPYDAWQALEDLVDLDAHEAIAKVLAMRSRLDKETLPDEEESSCVKEAFERALYYGRTQCAKILLEYGKFELPEDCLVRAVISYDDPELVRVLIAAGCKGDEPMVFKSPWDESERRITPLCYALEKGHLQAARALIAAGADPNPAWVENNPHPVAIAAVSGDPAVLDILKEGGAKLDEEKDALFCFAVRSKNTTLFHQLLQEIQLEGKQDILDLALYYAAREGTADAVECLLERGAKPDAQPTLNVAVERTDDGQRDSIIDLLLAAGANPNWCKGDGYYTPLQVACNSRFPSAKVVEKLLAAGADATVITEDGHSLYCIGIWHYSSSHSTKLERLLHDHGARRTFMEKVDSACHAIDCWLSGRNP